MMNSVSLLIFAKPPVPGMVKTRLQPQVSEENSARLQDACIRDAIRKALGISGVDAYLGYPAGTHVPYFEEASDVTGIKLFSQQGETLGKKLQHAFSHGFSLGYRKMVVIGVDSPTLPPDYIREGIVLLDHYDAVFGPSVDGGYYLVGMKAPHPLFPDDELGTENVLAEALERGEGLGLKIAALPPWYDLDRFQDLCFAATHIRLLKMSGSYFPPLTEKVLVDLLGIYPRGGDGGSDAVP